MSAIIHPEKEQWLLPLTAEAAAIIMASEGAIEPLQPDLRDAEGGDPQDLRAHVGSASRAGRMAWAGEGSGDVKLRAPFLYFGDPMAYARAHVEAGVLRIDDEGLIWRTAVNARGYWKPITPRRAENPGNKGYLRVTLHVPEHGLVQVMAHNLIWEMAMGPVPEGKELNHKDLCTSNNRLSNLEPVTKSENIQHSYANGRTKPWIRATTWRGKPRVTPDQIAQIQSRRASGASLKAIAAEFGIAISHTHRLCQKGGGW